MLNALNMRVILAVARVYSQVQTAAFLFFQKARRVRLVLFVQIDILVGHMFVRASVCRRFARSMRLADRPASLYPNTRCVGDWIPNMDTAVALFVGLPSAAK